MSYKPLQVESGLEKGDFITKQPLGRKMRSDTVGAQVPRHSIAISLTLAVVSYCCCSPLGIIPIIMVIFAYVKRESGKPIEATRMSNYSRCASGIVIVIGVVLFILTLLYFIASVYFTAYAHNDMMDYEYYGDDMVYPENYDYNTYGGDDYIDEEPTEMPLDTMDEEPTYAPIEFVEIIVEEGMDG